MFRVVPPAKPDDIQLSAVVFVMTLGLRITTHNARHPDYSARPNSPFDCSVRHSLFWVLQPKLLGMFAIVPRVLIANFPNPCAVAFPTARF